MRTVKLNKLTRVASVFTVVKILFVTTALYARRLMWSEPLCVLCQ